MKRSSNQRLPFDFLLTLTKHNPIAVVTGTARHINAIRRQAIKLFRNIIANTPIPLKAYEYPMNMSLTDDSLKKKVKIGYKVRECV